MVHELKIWPQYFEDVESGRKNFEVRKLDRLFGVGDTLHLKEWSPTGGYSGRETKKIVTYVMPGGQWGLSEGNCIMGIYPTPEGVTAEAVMDRHYNQNLGFLSVTWEQVISAMHEYASLVSTEKEKELQYAITEGMRLSEVATHWQEQSSSKDEEIARLKEDVKELVEGMGRCESWISACNENAGILSTINPLIQKHKQP